MRIGFIVILCLIMGAHVAFAEQKNACITAACLKDGTCSARTAERMDGPPDCTDERSGSTGGGKHSEDDSRKKKPTSTRITTEEISPPRSFSGNDSRKPAILPSDYAPRNHIPKKTFN